MPPSLLAVSALNDELVGSRLMIARLKTQCGLAPGGQRAGMSDGGLTFTTTMRVIAGVHYGTANGGTDAHVTLLTGLTDLDGIVLYVTNLTYGSLAAELYIAHFAGGDAPVRDRSPWT